MTETREFVVGIRVKEGKEVLLDARRNCSLVLVPGEKQFAREFLIRELGLCFADALTTLAVLEGVDP